MRDLDSVSGCPETDKVVYLAWLVELLEWLKP